MTREKKTVPWEVRSSSQADGNHVTSPSHKVTIKIALHASGLAIGLPKKKVKKLDGTDRDTKFGR